MYQGCPESRQPCHRENGSVLESPRVFPTSMSEDVVDGNVNSGVPVQRFTGTGGFITIFNHVVPECCVCEYCVSPCTSSYA